MAPGRAPLDGVPDLDATGPPNVIDQGDKMVGEEPITLLREKIHQRIQQDRTPLGSRATEFAISASRTKLLASR